jgi:hypothetical protein
MCWAHNLYQLPVINELFDWEGREEGGMKMEERELRVVGHYYDESCCLILLFKHSH